MVSVISELKLKDFHHKMEVAMIFKMSIIWMLITFFVPSVVFSESVGLELVMLNQTLVPGTPFGLSLHVQNSTQSFPDADLFIALDIGTGDYFFYPSWCHYPSEIDWEDTSFPAPLDETRTILPEFSWPTGCGNGSAQFIALVLAGDVLISNISCSAFSYSEAMYNCDLTCLYVENGGIHAGGVDTKGQFEISCENGSYVDTITYFFEVENRFDKRWTFEGYRTYANSESVYYFSALIIILYQSPSCPWLSWFISLDVWGGRFTELKECSHEKNF